MTELAREILNDLMQNSSYESPINSKTIEGKYNIGGVKVRLIMNEIIESDQPVLLCSNDRGYYIAQTVEESVEGIKNIEARFQSMLRRYNKMCAKHNSYFLISKTARVA